MNYLIVQLTCLLAIIVRYLNERFSVGAVRSFTPSAFIQNRKKIDPEVFNHLSRVTAHS
ncbi:hypothetical protein [Mucilaginibacter sp. 5C4]|uniref:hypothetical protein n=1 Tax=Mucilaginibacter sp. 5C4 TaxID=3048589 RepID=UPI002AC971F7|nr:hypothetical protein [Mucilaginibacter sp. 5C4]WPX22346.1 hypothetical protein RHM67_13735 [Mucilaginibacter sp. 5C4]